MCPRESREAGCCTAPWRQAIKAEGEGVFKGEGECSVGHGVSLSTGDKGGHVGGPQVCDACLYEVCVYVCVGVCVCVCVST